MLQKREKRGKQTTRNFFKSQRSKY
nr:unnamed protein product [Callosobruchus analis]